MATVPGHTITSHRLHAVEDLVFSEVYCTNCGAYHIDREQWAMFNHQKHLCAVCKALFYSTEEHVGVAKPEMMNPPSRTRPHRHEMTQKLVKRGSYYVPVPHVTTLDDTIEEAMRRPPEG